MIAFAFFILLYLHGIVHSVTRGLPCVWNHTGLSRSELITRWVRCCLYAEGTTSMQRVAQNSQSCPCTFLVKAYQQLSLFRYDDAYNSSHMFTIPPKPAPSELLLPEREPCPGSFEPGIIPHARAGRLT